MAIPVEMPKLGNTVEDCLLVRWNKQPGDTVSAGEVIAEIETDKTAFEIAAPAGGTFLATFFTEGELVPVFANICVIGEPGENVEQYRPGRPAVEANVPPANAAQFSPAPPAPAEAPLSPRARRFAEEHGFRPESVTGSGPGGRVLEDDLKRLYHGSPARLSAVRERIARRMRESLSGSAQYTLNTSADATGLLALRRKIKADHEERGGPDINVNELVMFCVVKALTVVPELNAEFIDGKICRHSSINLGFACDTPRGLLVPVVKESQRLSLPELALRVKALAQQALDGTIAPENLSGGTFTVSNLGNLGIESFTPILNPPQVALLGVNSIELKPVRRNGQVEFVDHIGLSLTCDHQVVDGALGAKFLKVLGEQIAAVESIAGLGS